jgi:paraquat-inducible protein B|tara:strand:+ start:41468 stop:44110 length:2643 start_codon:yes stop_codon:yes gene_type:complete
MSEEKIETLVYEPKTTDNKSISFIWLLPLVVLMILGWIAYESYTKKGTNISVIFKSAEDLKEGVTPLEYKGLVLGKVTKIEINDLNSVKVNILVNSDVAKYVATEGTSFWIKKPTISLTKVSGLGTLLSGNKIELYPKYKTLKEYDNANPQYEFTGLDTKPSLLEDTDGYYVNILSRGEDLIEVETPIFYNRFQIGEISSKEFKDGKVYLKAYIYDKYTYLINKSSQFVMNKALKVNFGPGGLNLEVSSLYSAIVGGITVETPLKDAQKIKEDKYYILSDDKKEFIERTPISLKFTDAKGIGINTLIMYKGVEVGKVDDLQLTQDNIIAKAYIYKKYDYLLTDNSSFNIEETEVSLDGVKNLNSIVSGNYLTIDYKKGKPKDSFEIVNSSMEKVDNDLVITLKTQNLNSITKNSKLYFKNIPIGKVLDYSLSSDLKHVNISLLVKEKYKKLINNKSLFYDMSSKLLELKNLDLDINYTGIKPLIDGGIALVEVDRKAKYSKKSFKLYSSYKDVQALKREYSHGSYLNTYFDNGFNLKVNQAISYKNQEIGFVKSIKFGEEKSKVKLFIYKKYMKYISKKSRFYKKDAIKVDASLGGVLFEVDNLSSLLYGSLELDNSSKTSFPRYEIYSSYDDMKNFSNTISILFDDVEGLRQQFSKLNYKGVDIGKVSNVLLTPQNKVLVKIQVFKNYDRFSKEGTIFYLKKPKVSLNEVKNIGSTILPVDIGVISSNKSSFQNSFIGYDSLEDIKKIDNGEIIRVTSIFPTKLNVDAPIYYKNVQIGKINKINLSKDGSKTLIDCFISDKYKHLIRKNSTFHDISGFKLKFSIFTGTEIETNTFTSILKGGLLVVTPLKYDKVATINDTFLLKKELNEDWEKINPSIK